ncbi:MAG: M28 family peptidase [Pyrodictiaceae archaeon]
MGGIREVSDKIPRWVAEIYDISMRYGGRLPGSSGDREVEEYLKEKLVELGVPDVRKAPYTLKKWIPLRWELEVEGLGSLTSFYMARTRPGTVEAKLSYIGDAHSTTLSGDVSDRIVVGDLEFPSLDLGLLTPMALHVSDPDGSLKAILERGAPEKPSVYMTTLTPSECGCPVAPEAYEASIEAGAVGFIGILTNYPDMGCGSFTYYAPSDGVFRPLTGLWVDSSTGVKLKEAAKREARARVSLEAEEGETTGYNIYGILPGKSDDIIIVHSHHDAPFGGAVQDASGVAMVIALAEYYASLPESRRGKTMVFLFTEGHFDAGSGQEAFMNIHEPNMKDKIVADIAIEHIGKEYAVKDGKAYYTGYPEPRAIFVSEDKEYLVNAFKKALLEKPVKRLLLLPTKTILGVPSDANRFWKRGIPVASLISGPIYMFSACDTPDKLADDYADILLMFVKAIDGLSSA